MPEENNVDPNQGLHYLLLIQHFSGERMCTILVKRLED